MIVHAVSIHSGGGKVLLDQLLQEKTFGSISILICDERYVLPAGSDRSFIVYKVRPNLLERWKSEILLKKLSNANSGMTVLCFSNLPPAFKLKNKVVLYLQNALLLPGVPPYTSSPKVALRLVYEKLWSQLFWKNINEVWVQTEWMKKALEKSGRLVLVKPFLPSFPQLSTDIDKKYDFVTISGTAYHKRLLHLLKAWSFFAETTMPSLLVVTDGSNGEIEEYFNKLKGHVSVKVNASRDEIFKCYEESRNLIVTSMIESYCLPIYEAAHFKLKIYAPEENYVKDSKLADFFIDMSSPEKTKTDIESYFQKI